MPNLPRLANLVRLRRSTGEPRPVKLLHIGVALALTLVTATLVAGALLAGALAWIGLPSKVTLDTTNLLEIVKISLAVVGGIGGAVALVVAYRKQRLAEEDNHRAREQNDRAREAARREDTKLYVERFTTAANQLGSDAPAVRLAGVHALAALADDWEGGRQMCIDVLCAYLRMPPEPEPDAGHNLAGHVGWRAMREVRATIVRLIAAHLSGNAPISWSGADLDFTGVVFDGANFRDAVFSGGLVSFGGAEFSDGLVSFNGAKFSDGTVSFAGAKFSGGTVSFGWAEFSGRLVTFAHAEFSDGRVSFVGAKFSEGLAWFDGAVFSGSRVVFDGAEFSDGGVSFAGAEFSDGLVSFDRAVFSGSLVVFAGAEFSGGLVDFSETADWSHPPIELPDQAPGLRTPPANKDTSENETEGRDQEPEANAAGLP
ncbi:pentapeptide repeat-containing protein [Microbispora cellulosiformans]|uniref:Pentapeptide repeat-containing protein n=1 Tax=Microbispora cellulosiformans TaxID=2614688 RepID=A0A5J5JY00_9ACTN|nr:pentapeptide repeat-containing protein [Microbispora cellulosiformans]KAA9375199.1 pentapeptide repeat-containing protein [Microbispora cellulosiformans]